jgi:hypothetical protein
MDFIEQILPQIYNAAYPSIPDNYEAWRYSDEGLEVVNILLQSPAVLLNYLGVVNATAKQPLFSAELLNKSLEDINKELCSEDDEEDFDPSRFEDWSIDGNPPANGVIGFEDVTDKLAELHKEPDYDSLLFEIYKILYPNEVNEFMYWESFDDGHELKGSLQRFIECQLKQDAGGTTQIENAMIRIFSVAFPDKMLDKYNPDMVEYTDWRCSEAGEAIFGVLKLFVESPESFKPFDAHTMIAGESDNNPFETYEEAKEHIDEWDDNQYGDLNEWDDAPESTDDWEEDTNPAEIEKYKNSDKEWDGWIKEVFGEDTAEAK